MIGTLEGEKILSRKGNSAKINSTKRSKRFTVLGVTNLSRQPIMCVVIMEGKERNVFLESGIDPFHPFYESYAAAEDELKSNYTFFEDNYGPGNLFPGRLVCEFEGTKILTMVRYSEKGSITPDILTDILRTIDKLKIFKVYRDNGAMSFLLVDGHQSQFHTTFLQYITDEKHPWKVSIGVPYGTSLWQVGDSYQQNGRFKIALMNLKKQIIDKRIQLFYPELKLQGTDIMPIILHAWKVSFADVARNKEAISEIGLNPLNKNLLLLGELTRTITQSDKEEMDSLAIVTPEKLLLVQNNPGSNKQSHTDTATSSSN